MPRLYHRQEPIFVSPLRDQPEIHPDRKTLNDKYGFAVRSPEGWRYTRSRSREEDRQIALLFDSLRKNLREGFFTIPNPEGVR